MFDTAYACMYICTSVLYVYVKYENACQLRVGAVQPFCSEETACIASSSTKWMYAYVYRICIFLKKHIIAKYDLLCIYMCKNKCMYIIYICI